ncbi:MAG: hypothetical protein ACOCUY_00715 [Verrucomicrobiota bacterium]
MNGRFLHIARNTFRECLREPIFLILALTACVLIGALPGMTLFVFREQQKLVTDSGMAATLLFGLIVAVMCAARTVAAEIRGGTSLLVLSKPVNRTVFMTAKLSGVLLATAAFWFLCSTSTLIAERVATDQFRFDLRAMSIFFASLVAGCLYGGLRNYFAQASFCAAAVTGLLVAVPVGALIIRILFLTQGAPGFHWELLPALVLLLQAVLVFGAVAVAVATRLDWTGTLILCSAVFVVGLMSDYLIGRHADESILAAFLYAIVPNWQLFWMADALAAEQLIPLRYVIWASGYAALLVGLFAALASIMFSGREVGDQG